MTACVLGHEKDEGQPCSTCAALWQRHVAEAVEGGREDDLRKAIATAIRAAADDRHACETLKRRLHEALKLTDELGVALHGRSASQEPKG